MNDASGRGSADGGGGLSSTLTSGVRSASQSGRKSR